MLGDAANIEISPAVEREEIAPIIQHIRRNLARI
jgi:hypothetical protein